MLEDFDIDKVKGGSYRVTLSIRTSKERFDWIKENHVSATKLFNYFIVKVMEKDDKTNKAKLSNTNRRSKK